VNVLFAIELSSNFLQGSNAKYEKQYTYIR